MKTMLVVVAHPSDESFFVGGTISKYASMGWSIHVIVASDGEKGESGTFVWAKDTALGSLRQQETMNAAKMLGVKKVSFLHAPDKGLSHLSPGTLEDPILRAMEELLPDVVVTHDPTGFTNDPDNNKVCISTTFAFQKYTDHLNTLKHPDLAKTGRGKEWKEDAYERAFSDVHPDDKEPKLYYVCVPEHVVSYLKSKHFLPDMAYDKPIVGVKDKYVTTSIDITDAVIAKGKALLCHETQKSEVDSFIDFDKNPLHKEEYFVLRMQGIHEVFMGKNDRIAESL